LPDSFIVFSFLEAQLAGDLDSELLFPIKQMTTRRSLPAGDQSCDPAIQVRLQSRFACGQAPTEAPDTMGFTGHVLRTHRPAKGSFAVNNQGLIRTTPSELLFPNQTNDHP
jgi:hypothetical protein